jgi:hypothetical protein
MSYKQISPATDWVYVQLPTDQNNNVVVYPVAVWALNEENCVIGLISVAGGGNNDTTMGRVPCLVSPPPLKGIYKHMIELNEVEKESLTTRKPVRNPG